MMLRCRACGRDVPLSEFCYSSAAIICELRTKCRECHAADRTARPIPEEVFEEFHACTRGEMPTRVEPARIHPPAQQRK